MVGQDNVRAGALDSGENLKDDALLVQPTFLRGCFDRFSHDKIFIVSKSGSPIRVLTGSTNFSITGLYVNANHVLVFEDNNVAAKYAGKVALVAASSRGLGRLPCS